MSGAPRKWVAGHTRWRLQWTDETTFKVDHEGDNLTDKALEEWGAWVDSQIEDRFGDVQPRRLIASSLNFSRNGLGDEAVRSVVEYLRRREIGVQTLKLFRNSIGDAGAWAVGQLLALSRTPVHEVHLSHNALTEQGACSVLESIARSSQYPYLAEHSGRRDGRGLAPVWLRLEHNNINWGIIEHRLTSQHIRWCTADSRDGWTPKDRAPMLCMHHSYRNQNVAQFPGPHSGDWASGAWDQPNSAQEPSAPAAASNPAGDAGGHEAALDGSLILAALQGDGAAKQSLDAQLGQGPHGAGAPGQGEGPAAPPEAAAEEAAEDSVPLYVFLDAGSVDQMIKDDRGVFSFKGLRNLLHQGHMKCTLQEQEGRQMPSWFRPAEEHECVMLVVTNDVLEELAKTWEQTSCKNVAQTQVSWLRDSEDSPLSALMYEWSVLEVLETQLHTQLMRLTAEHGRRAQEMRVPHQTLKLLDFVSLWESQIEAEGRVLVLTSDSVVCRFSKECAELGPSGLCPPVLHIDALNRRFAEDTAHGGRFLCEAARMPRAAKFCGAVLSASLLAAVACLPTAALPPAAEGGDGSGDPDGAEPEPPRPAAEEAAAWQGDGGDETHVLRRELREAVDVVAIAHRLLSAGAGGDDGDPADAAEVARCMERMDDAQQRWSGLLDRKRAWQ